MLAELEKPIVLPIRDQIYGKLKSLVTSDHCKVGQKLPTSREMARHFNVSLATAQAAVRMLEKGGVVSCEVGRGTYVRRTLEPSESAELRRKTIPSIAVLTGPILGRLDTGHPGTDWTAGIVYGIQHGLADDGYAVRLLPWRDDNDTMANLERRLAKIIDALSGVVAFPVPELDRLLQTLDQRGLPWVTINQYNHLSTRNYVTADYYGGGVEVGKLFGQLGLRRVLFLTSSGHSYSALQKENGMRDGLRMCGVPLNEVEVRHCPFYLTQDGWETTARYLRQAPQPPQAIFTTGDLLALGAVKACQERGLRVPEDVAVVGSTGIEAGEHSTPTLSTVQLPMMEMGKEAALMLLSLIRKREKHTAGRILPAHLVQRGSTPPLPAITNKGKVNQ